MSGEIILRALVFILVVPIIGATVAYRQGRHAAAMVWNGIVPILLVGASALAMLVNPTPITAGAALLFTVPLGIAAACAVGYRRRSPHPLLFWFPWFGNLAIAAFLVYLTFWFRIF